MPTDVRPGNLSAEEAWEKYTDCGAEYADYVHLIDPGMLERWIARLKPRTVNPRSWAKPVVVNIDGPTVSLSNSDGELLIDPGHKLPARPPSGRGPALVILTHAHTDHVSGLEKVLDDWPCEEVCASQETLDIVSERLRQRGKYQTEQKLRECSLPVGQGSIWMSKTTGIKIKFWQAGHCLGNLACEIYYPGDDQAILVVGEFSHRDVGGVSQRIPVLGPVRAILMEACHADETDLPTGNSTVNRSSIRSLASATYGRGRSSVFGTYSLAEGQEVYAAIAEGLRERLLPGGRLQCIGFSPAVRKMLESGNYGPPWDIGIEWKDRPYRGTISLATGIENDGIKSDSPFVELQKRFSEYGDIDWYLPRRYMGKSEVQGYYDAFTHASLPEIIQMSLMQSPDKIILYGSGQQGSNGARLLKKMGFKVSECLSGHEQLHL